MTGTPRVRPDADLDEVVAILERDGAVIVEDLVDDETLARLWDDLGPALDARDFSGDWYNGTRTRRVSSLFARTAQLTPVVTHPLYLGAARRIMQKPTHIWMGKVRVEMVPSIQISGTQVIQIHPGQGKQPLHRDDALHLRPHPGPTSRVQLMLAMSEFTAENGGTMVIPGSHHWDDERAPGADEAFPTEMSAGSGLIWLGGVYHGGGATWPTPRARGSPSRWTWEICARRRTSTSPSPGRRCWPIQRRSGGCWGTTAARRAWAGTRWRTPIRSWSRPKPHAEGDLAQRLCQVILMSGQVILTSAPRR
nr:hypothetical protein GCM10020093_073290 [Planobispora longispora]